METGPGAEPDGPGDLPSGCRRPPRWSGSSGDPVAHSLSPLLHNTAFAELGLDWVSVGFPVAAGPGRGGPGRGPGPGHPGAVGDHAPQGGRGRGWSAVAHPMADRLGAVNCVVDDGRRRGGATTPTGPAFVAALAGGATGSTPTGRRCLVVGAGGAARAVIAALADAGAAEVVVVNRTPERAAAAAGPGRAGGPGGHRRTRPGLRPGGQRHARRAWPTSADGAGRLAGRPGAARARPGGGGPRLPPAGHTLAGGGAGPGGRPPTASGCWSTRPPSRWSAGPGSSHPVEAMWAAVAVGATAGRPAPRRAGAGTARRGRVASPPGVPW